MTRNKLIRVIFPMIMIGIMMVPGVAMAATGPSVPPPIAVVGPRLKPPPIPATNPIAPSTAYNYVITGNVPQALEANAADGGATQEAPGRGVKQTTTSISNGILLNVQPNVCNDFNAQASYAAFNVKSDVWTDWYGGWGPFAINNGYYQAKNVTFSMERTVGPGSKWGDNSHSVKIASHEPYAGGYGSPIIPVPADYQWGTVTVSVDYLVWDHDQGGKQGGPDGFDWDWASMGVKPGAAGDQAYYVNGYTRGTWSELTQTVELGGAKDIMVLLQGQSPAVLNSNIYFDNVRIAFTSKDGSKSVYLTNCSTADNIK